MFVGHSGRLPYAEVMVKTGVLTTSGKRTVDLREVNQYAGRVYREVESFGVQVTVTDHGRPVARIVPIREDESWCERMVREGRVRPARNGWRMPEARWQVPESLGLEEFLLHSLTALTVLSTISAMISGSTLREA